MKKEILKIENDKQLEDRLKEIEKQFKKFEQDILINIENIFDGYIILTKVLELKENSNPIQTRVEGQSPIVFINYYETKIPNLYLVRKEKFDELDNDSMQCELLFTNEIDENNKN